MIYVIITFKAFKHLWIRALRQGAPLAEMAGELAIATVYAFGVLEVLVAVVAVGEHAAATVALVRAGRLPVGSCSRSTQGSLLLL